MASALALATFGSYFRLVDSPFIDYDDPAYVVLNRHVQAGLSLDGIRWAFETFECANWHPLTWISLELDATLYGGRSAGRFHLTNLLLHVASTVLLFLVLESMTGAALRAAMVAGLFALHPAHVESVAWVAERKDVLSTLFWMLTMAAYVGYVRRGGWRYSLVMLCLALGLMAKPMLVTLPFVLLLFDFWPLGRAERASWRRLTLEKIPLFLLVLASCVITYYAQRSGRAVMSFQEYPVPERIANAIVAYARYLGMAIWPVAQAIYYPHPHITLMSWRVLGAGLLLVVLTLFALAVARRWPYVPVGWFWYLGALVPVIGLVQVGGQGLADRYTYIPLIGIFILAIWAIADLASTARIPRGLTAAAGLAVLARCAMLTSIQVGYWADPIRLWTRALEVTGENDVAHSNLGIALVNQHRPGEAAEHYHKAIQISPGYTQAHINLGSLLADQGRLQDAASEFSEATRLNPASVTAKLGLASALLKMGQADQAESVFLQALALDPDLEQAHIGVGIARMMRQETVRALESFSDAIKIDGGQAQAHLGLGLALRDLGKTEQALAELKVAAALDPKLFHATLTLVQIEIDLGHYAAAETEARQALVALPPSRPERAAFEAELIRCQRLQSLEKRLPAFLNGRAQPEGPADLIAVARICQSPRHERHVAAARFYQAAMASAPGRMKENGADPLYQSACAAAQAGTGAGADAANLPEAEKSKLRGQALEWLKAYREYWISRASAGGPAERRTATRALSRLFDDSSFERMRGRHLLEGVPPRERQAWIDFWSDLESARNSTSRPEGSRDSGTRP